MMIYRFSLRYFPSFLLLTLVAINNAWARQTVTYPIYFGDVERVQMHIDVLKLALAHSDNEYEVKPHETADVSPSRAEKMVSRGQLDVMWSASDSLRESRVSIVPVPLDYGLLGFRLLMILEEKQPAFSEVDRLSDLQKFQALQVNEWVDTYILLNAGFDVHLGHYENLPKMLAAKRGDFIPRSIREIRFDMVRWATDGNFVVDQRSLLIYRQGDFFFVNKQNHKLHQDLKVGLERIYDNGKLKSLLSDFMEDEGVDIEKEINKRVSFRLNNPYLTDAVKAIDDKYFNVFFAEPTN
ncbi:MAG: hypothetical protein ACRBB4_15025 [Neptuniibacter sp.]